MKCKIHPYEHGVGVCASCLRERLFDLIAAQKQLSGDFHHHRHIPAPPQHLLFPRSVSPYVAHRRSVGSDASLAHHHQLFFSTPQVGPSFSSAAPSEDYCRRRRSGRFSVLKVVFGQHHKSDDLDFKLGVGSRKGSGSSSWFSALFRRRGKKPAEDAAVPRRRSYREVEKGMSPAMDDGRSGYSSDSSKERRRRRPMPTPLWWFPASRIGGHHHNHQRSSVGAIPGFVFCLSPLARSGTNGRRRQAAAAEGGGGDGRSAAGSSSLYRGAGPGGTGGPSLEPNRSRKFVHLGRFK